MNNESKLKVIIADMFDVKKSQICADSGFLKGDIKNWDSLGHLMFVLKIEEELQIKFSRLYSTDAVKIFHPLLVIERRINLSQRVQSLCRNLSLTNMKKRLAALLR